MWLLVREIWPRSWGHISRTNETAKMTDLPCRVLVSCLTHHWCNISWLLCKIRFPTVIRMLTRYHQVKYKVNVIWGHQGSPNLTNRFLLIACDWKEIQTCEWSHCICFVKTHRISIHVQHDLLSLTWVTLTWGQILTLIFQGHIIYKSPCLDETNTMMSK